MKKIGITFPSEYLELVSSFGGATFDYYATPYKRLGRSTPGFAPLTELLEIPGGAWLDMLRSPDTSLDGAGMCNAYRVFASLEWQHVSGWWPLLVPIIYSEGSGYLAYDFRYSKDCPPIVLVSHEMFELPGDPNFLPPEYVASGLTDLLYRAEQQIPGSRDFPSSNIDVDEMVRDLEWEAARDGWLLDDVS